MTFFRFGLRDRQKERKDQRPLFTDSIWLISRSRMWPQKNLFSARESIVDTIIKRERATDRYLVWNEDWNVEGDENDHRIQVNDRGTELQLLLKSLKPPVLHGQNGLSQKGEGEGRASYYYSLTRMQTEGS